MKNQEKPSTKFFQEDVDNYKKEFYGSGYRTFMSVRLDRFLMELDKLSLPTGSKCLDAGCGPGLLTKAMYERGYSTSSLDSSPEMLRLTKSLFENIEDNQPYEFLEGNIEELPFNEETFDLVASAGVIEYLSTDDKVLNEFNRVLKPNGYLILSSTSKYSPIGIFEPIVESVKRNDILRKFINVILTKLGGTPVRPREFQVRKHSMAEFNSNIENGNFEILTSGYFYALPWPHPFDRIMPNLSSKIGRLLEKLAGTPVKYTFEGIYVIAKKKDM